MLINIKDIKPSALRRYANNLEEIEKLKDQLRYSRKEIDKLLEQNEYIEINGELPVFNSDDIPF
jgi:hypothetical protein